ncbi:hypothetical protein [Cohnella cholangitidis]|nr:hypothetical protein [Cohnella cholangitidis]
MNGLGDVIVDAVIIRCSSSQPEIADILTEVRWIENRNGVVRVEV